MDEEQLTIIAAVFISMDNSIAIAILMAVLVRITKLATTIKKDFSSSNSFIIKIEIRAQLFKANDVVS